MGVVFGSSVIFLNAHIIFIARDKLLVHVGLLVVVILCLVSTG